MLGYFIFEWNKFTKNIKNRAVFLLFLFMAAFHALFIVPHYQPIEGIDLELIQDELAEGQHFLNEAGFDTEEAGSHYLMLQ